jgi:nitrogen-specific signal transduction histidine kinase
VIDKIFIPFFTTKRSGSGIGLSLSRQILRLHGGTITAKSIPDEGDHFHNDILTIISIFKARETMIPALFR